MLGQVQQLDTPAIDYGALVPLLILIGGSLALMVVGSLLPRRPRWSWHALVTIATAGASVISALVVWGRIRDEGGVLTVADAVRVDTLTLFLSVVIGSSVVVTALLTESYLRREKLESPEPYVLLLLSASGGYIMAMSNDLLVLFVGLEILSIAVYVLAAVHTRRARSGEAAIKYFVLGAFSSAFFLYGVALVYGATGSTNLTAIQSFLATTVLTNNLILLGGFAMLLVGLGFKVAAAPFHSWAPDVYEGSPSPMVAYMGSGVKVAGFAGLVRVFVYAFSNLRTDWQPIIYVLAVATLLVGSILAVRQTNVKRMLAYSSISHAGFMLLGIQAGTDRGVTALLFYLATYTFTVAGSFGVVSLMGKAGGDHDLSHYRGLAKRAPLVAFAFLVFLLAQAGVPLTSGFWAKFFVLGAAVDARSFWLALVAMITAVISAYVYLRIVLAMYGEPAEESAGGVPVPGGVRVALVVSVLVTVGVGVVPGPLDEAAVTATPAVHAAPAVGAD